MDEIPDHVNAAEFDWELNSAHGGHSSKAHPDTYVVEEDKTGISGAKAMGRAEVVSSQKNSKERPSVGDAWGGAKKKVKSTIVRASSILAVAKPATIDPGTVSKESLLELREKKKKQQAEEARHWQGDPRLRPLVGKETDYQSYIIPPEKKPPKFQPSLWVRDRALQQDNWLEIGEDSLLRAR